MGCQEQTRSLRLTQCFLVVTAMTLSLITCDLGAVFELIGYIFSESTFPLLIEILSLETRLKSLYSRNMFQGSTYTPQIGHTDCEFVI